MNKAEFLHILRNSNALNAEQTEKLETIISDFPYFQAAKAIQLSGLHKAGSYKYNSALKITAAHTIDRSVLFNFITAPLFINSNSTVEILEEIDVIEPYIIQPSIQKNISELLEETIKKIEIPKKNDAPLLQETLEEDNFVEDESTIESKESAIEKLEIGKPIRFKSSEPHSFNEWMQLAVENPTDSLQEKENKLLKEPDKKPEKLDKFSIIEKFIATNPKIKPVDKNAENIDISIKSLAENNSLMTETLAKVYLEQKKYDNAIQAYHILSLKYPEKSSFFADQIKAIKIVQKK